MDKGSSRQAMNPQWMYVGLQGEPEAAGPQRKLQDPSRAAFSHGMPCPPPHLIFLSMMQMDCRLRQGQQHPYMNTYETSLKHLGCLAVSQDAVDADWSLAMLSKLCTMYQAAAKKVQTRS